MFSVKNACFAALLLLAEVNAIPTFYRFRREVPQEHSHEKILTSVRQSLNIDNPDKIVDVVFGLLGNAAATNGLGNLQDPDCLQQGIADRAFTNAKANNDVQGMTDALIFRALERNTGAVGQASVACTSVNAVNPEIAAIQQHQDPASTNAATVNKDITLELARQIASIGGDPQDALLAGTFAPGKIGDPTAAGNTCDDANDAEGCIFTLNRLVADATVQEIDAAVNGAGNANAGNENNGGAANNNAGNENNNGAANNNAGNENNNGAANNNAGNENNNAAGNNKNKKAGKKNKGAKNGNAASEACPPPTTVTVTAAAAEATDTPANNAEAIDTPANNGESNNLAANNNAGANSNNAGQNLQTFTGALGNIQAPTVVAGGRGFVVENNSDFLNLSAALGRSCDVQKNKCADAVNSRALTGLTVGDCDKQNGECRANIQ